MAISRKAQLNVSVTPEAKRMAAEMAQAEYMPITTWMERLIRREHQSLHAHHPTQEGVA